MSIKNEINFLQRSLKRSFEHLKSSKWLSIASIVVITLTFTISGVIVFIASGMKKTVDELTARPRIYVYFYPATEEENVLAIQEQINKIEGVESTEYESQSKALENLRNKLGNDFGSQVTDIASLLPPRINIKPKSLDKVDGIIIQLSTLLKDNLYFDEIRYSSESIQYLNAISKMVTTNSIILVSISLVATFLIIYVSINYSIKYYLEEIRIMDILGSKTSMLVVPFIFEGIFFGIIGGLLAGINITAFKYGNYEYLLKDEVLSKILSNNEIIRIQSTISKSEIFATGLKYTGICILISVALCAISSLIAASLNINKIRSRK